MNNQNGNRTPPPRGTGQGTYPPNGGQRRTLTPEEQKKRAEIIRKARAEQAKRAAKEQKKQEKERLTQEKQAAKRRQKEYEQRRKAAEKMRRHDERFELTEEERAIRDQMKREEKQYAAKRRAKKAKIYTARFFLFLGMFVVLLALSIGAFFLNLHQSEITAKRDFSYIVGKKTYSEPYEQMMRGGKLYVNITPIVELCSFATTGDQTSLRYITRNNKENVQFNVGSRQIFVNGAEQRISADPIFENGELWIPYDFLPSFVSGLTLSEDTSKNKVSIKRATDEKTGEELDISFLIRSVEPLAALNEYNEFGNTSPVEFKADLDLYEEFMNPADRDGYLFLVNSEYPLPLSYIPEKEQINDIRIDGRPLQYVTQVTEKAAHAMVTEGRANGFEHLAILLGYRTYTAQKNVFDARVKEYARTMSDEKAEAAAAAEVQRPGCNPQQAGYSIILHDMENEDSATNAFAKTECYAWLVENCWKFGFILRYPADKVAETGMPFQPCYFTFVGRYHAMRIMESGLSMEEYIQQLEEKQYFGDRTYADFYAELVARNAQ